MAHGKTAAPEDSGDRRSPCITCVFLTPSEQEFDALRRLLAPTTIRIHHAATLEQARFTLTATRTAVVLTEIAFPDGDWKDAKDMLAQLVPRVELVVAALHADEGFWLDVLDGGAYDLVLKPFRAEEVRRILENAESHAKVQETRRPAEPRRGGPPRVNHYSRALQGKNQPSDLHPAAPNGSRPA